MLYAKMCKKASDGLLKLEKKVNTQHLFVFFPNLFNLHHCISNVFLVNSY